MTYIILQMSCNVPGTLYNVSGTMHNILDTLRNIPGTLNNLPDKLYNIHGVRFPYTHNQNPFYF